MCFRFMFIYKIVEVLSMVFVGFRKVGGKLVLKVFKGIKDNLEYVFLYNLWNKDCSNLFWYNNGW